MTPTATADDHVTATVGEDMPSGGVVEQRSTRLLGRWTSWRVVARATRGQHVTERVAPGSTTCLRLRAGRFVSRARCVTALVDGSHMRARGMRVVHHAYAAGGSLLVAHRAGSIATLARARADSIGVRVYACPDCGRLAIRVGGRTRAIVDTHRRDAGFVTIRALRFARTTTARIDVVSLDTRVVRFDGVVPWRSRG
jgi:hypothetical protein